MLLAQHQSWRSAWSVFKDSVATVFANWQALAFFLAIQIALLVALLYSTTIWPESSTAGVWISATISVLASLWQLIFIGVLVFLSADKRRRSVARIMRESVLMKLPALLLLSVLLWIVLMVATLAFIIPGVILYTYWCLAAFILLQEDTGVIASLRKSMDYVRGWWWPMFARNLFVFALFTAITLISIVPGPGLLVSSVLSFLFGPALVIFYQKTYQEMVDIKSYKHLQSAQVSLPAKFLVVCLALVLFMAFSVLSLTASYVTEIGQILPVPYATTTIAP